MPGLYYEFLAQLRNNGVAKTSHFTVAIPVPTSLLGVGVTMSSGEILSLRCEAAELPGKQLVAQENRIYGPVYKTIYQTVYQDITLTFLETENLFIRRFFEAWLNLAMNVDGTRLRFPNTYRVDMRISQYLPTGTGARKTEGGIEFVADTLDRTTTWHLASAFPIAVNQMPVAWSEDGFHRTTVTMAYEYYLITVPPEPTKPPTPPAPPAVKQKRGSAKQ